MKTIVRNIKIKSIACLMIGMMGMLVANKAVFMHTHRLNDGTIIEHAHPYNKSTDSKPYKSHHHTKAELLFFQNLEILFLFVFLTFASLNLVKKAKHSFYRKTSYTLTCIILHKGRAPPLS
jgi:hypothetical protein